ncbi:YcaO-like family protein [Streptomyces zagrosensis]|uniref:Ribosomal protein S12 methylthiotransferase accessory factor n=1 Tax=Streptomyces zagrosensis TaxID=1042984 RepID=A0A7W9QA28_9ACTN|nr:YcaO-like family protein [Streptomyces zagrosensis]MBB5936428.1 ribosomal protein S12 methylthiotransferase accessory factor [Streptomyces zagrosensis]
MSMLRRTRARRWEPQVFTPFEEDPGIVLARTAARAPEFAAVRAVGTRRGDDVVVGCAAGGDRADVIRRARGELLERMGNILAGRRAEAAPRWLGSYEDWRRRGVSALDPAALLGSLGSRVPRGLWIAARSLLTGDEVLVPAGAVYLRHRPSPGHAIVAGAGSTGLGAHPDPQKAVGHAAREILERDLIRRSWCEARAPAPHAARAGPDDLPVCVRNVLDQRELHATVLSLPAADGSICAVVCVHADDGTAQTFGARCAPARQRASAVASAAYEALMVRWSVTSPAALRSWAEWGGRTLPRSALEHALWTYHRQDSLGHWLDRLPHPTAPAGAGLEDGPAALAAHTGEDVLFVETDTPQIRAEGLSVVRLIAPGTRPLPSGDGGAPGALPHPLG